MAREMKDSGIEWIGEIPRDWKIEKYKHCFVCSKEIVGNKSNSVQLLSLTTRGIKKRSKNDTFGKVPDSYDTYQVVKQNDIVMCLFDLDVSAVFSGISPYNGMISPAYKVLNSKENVFPKYADYWFSYIFDGRKYKYYSKNLRFTLNYDEFAGLEMLLPSLNEQKCIANYLDTKCAHIDSVIEKTRAAIEKYKKLKQAVITQAVTKGIRPNREMKDSGIEWIDSIPFDWQECRIKNAIFPQQKPVRETDEIITCFRDGVVTLRKKRREDGFTISFTEHGYQGVDIGDLVIHGMDAFAGSIGCSDSRGKTTPVVHVCKTVGNNRYFMYYLRSLAYGNILMDLSNGVRIRSSDFRNFAKLGVFKTVVPPIDEQSEIVDYLDEKTAAIDSLIQKKEQLITELEAYKKSLIYEYITGKKEVEECQGI